MGNRHVQSRGPVLTRRAQHWDHTETMRAAENAFDAYVQTSAALQHYVSVTDRKGPIRRMDEDQEAPRQPAAKPLLVWSTARGRWYRNNGVLLVLEGELWRVILFYMRKTNADTSTSLYDAMSREVEGVERRDVVQVWQIWQNTGLDRTVFTQGVQWELSGQEESPSSQTSRIRDTPHPLASSSSSLQNWIGTLGQFTQDQDDFKPEFHPDHPRLLKIGTRTTDNTVVWITFIKGEKRASRCFSEDLQLMSVHKLGVKWLPRLQLRLFDGACRRDKETSRRDYLSALIEEHLSREPGPVNGQTMLKLVPGLRRRWKSADEDNSDTDDTSESSGCANQRSTRSTHPMTREYRDETTKTVSACLRSKTAPKRTPIVDLTDDTEHQTPKRRKEQSPEHMRTPQTVLRVSISNNPARAPVNILFADCGDVDALFHKVLIEGGIKESQYMNIRELSTTLTCSGRGHLIRRGNANDWDFFYKDLQRAWTREADHFVDTDFEVDILVHIDI